MKKQFTICTECKERWQSFQEASPSNRGAKTSLATAYDIVGCCCGLKQRCFLAFRVARPWQKLGSGAGEARDVKQDSDDVTPPTLAARLDPPRQTTTSTESVELAAFLCLTRSYRVFTELRVKVRGVLCSRRASAHKSRGAYCTEDNEPSRRSLHVGVF